MSKIMSPQHPQWETFVRLLGGPEGVNFRQDKNGPKWDCGGNNKPMARVILGKHFPEVNITETLKFFEEQGGFCDCEIILNVYPECLPPDMQTLINEIKDFISKNSGKFYLVGRLADFIIKFSRDLLKASDENLKALDAEKKDQVVSILREVLDRLS